MNLYKKNLLHLKNMMPEIYHVIKEESSQLDVKIEELTGKNLCVICGDVRCCLHSLYKKREEWELMFSEVTKDAEVLFLFGLGDGTVLPFIKKYFWNLKKLIVIEPTLTLFQQFLQQVDLTVAFQDWTTTFFLNKSIADVLELMEVHFKENESRKIAFTHVISYASLFAEYYQQLQQGLTDLIRIHRVRLATEEGLKYIFLENMLANLRIDHVMLEQLNDFFSGKPVVLVSAGPSLNQHLSLLPLLKERAILVASGSAIKILEKHGILPHFRISLDASTDNKDLILNTTLGHQAEVPLIYAGQIYKEILQEYQGMKILVTMDTDFIGQYAHEKMNVVFQEVPAGYSISNVAFNLLCKTSCSMIVFLGQDMCFYGDVMYAEGESRTVQQVYGQQKLLPAVDIYGQRVYSTYQYIVLKKNFGDSFRKWGEGKTVINASEGGLGIEGVPNIPLKELMETELQTEIKADFAQYLQKKHIEALKSSLFADQILLDFQKEAQSVKAFLETNLKFLKKIYKAKEKQQNLNRLKNDLAYLEKRQEDLDQQAFYSKIVISAVLGNVLHNRYYYDEEMAIDEMEVIQYKMNKFLNRYVVEKEYVETFLQYLQREMEFQERNRG